MKSKYFSIFVFALLLIFSSPITSHGTAPTSGLVGYWSFDEGSGTTAGDTSGNSNIGTLLGSPVWSMGKVGNGAITFGSNSQSVDVGAGSFLNLTGNLTITAWIKPSTYGGGNLGRIFHKDSSFNNYFFNVENDGALVKGLSLTNNGSTARSNASVIDTSGAWYHVAVSYNGSNATFYVNGSSAGSQTFSSNPTSASSIHGFIGNSGNSVYSFKGSIDEVRIYNRALSAQEVSDVYTDTGTGGTTSPPTISSISSGIPTASGATITWTTDTAAYSQVEYGLTSSYGANTQLTTSTSTSHSHTLSNLAPNTVYHYRVKSTDATGGLTTSSDNTLTTQTVVTPPPVVPPPVTPPSSGNCTNTNVHCVGSGQEYITIASAIAVVAAGDTVLVYPGTYTSGISISKSGSASNPIFIQSQTSGAAIISGGGGVVVNGSNITVDGFTITTDSVSIGGGSNNVIIKNNIIHDFNSVGIFVNGYTTPVSNVIIQANEIYNGHHDGIDLWGNTSNITIQYNHMHDFWPVDADHVDAIQAYGLPNQSNNNVTIRGNYFHNIIHEGILFKDFPTNNLTIVDNIINTGGSWDMYVFQTTGATIRHNTIKYLYFDPGNSNIILLDNLIFGKISMINGAPMSEFSVFGNNMATTFQNYVKASTDVTGIPTFIGGVNPTTWSDYQLTTGSLGYNQASDGQNIGTTYFGSGSILLPPPVTPPITSPILPPPPVLPIPTPVNPPVVQPSGGGGGVSPLSVIPNITSGTPTPQVVVPPPTPTPTTIPGITLTQTLSLGSKGTQVTTLQNYLISLGYLAQGNNDGNYGPRTQRAVQQYQCKSMNICSGSTTTNGYGMVGTRTRLSLSEGGSPQTTTNTLTAAQRAAIQAQINQLLILVQQLVLQLKQLKGL